MNISSTFILVELIDFIVFKEMFNSKIILIISSPNNQFITFLTYIRLSLRQSNVRNSWQIAKVIMVFYILL